VRFSAKRVTADLL